MGRIEKMLKQNTKYNKKKNVSRLTTQELNKERLLLRNKTMEMYDKGYVSDFVYRLAKKYKWFEVENEEVFE